MVIESIAATMATAFLVAKGIAAVLVNNLDTQKWGKIGKVLEWLASANKKAKLTGEVYADSVIKQVADSVPPKTIVGKMLKVLS